MAGILAVSATTQMASGDTAASNSFDGFIVAEEIELSVTPTGTDYEWGLSIPNTSTAARSALSGSTGASVTFTPDSGGLYSVRCTVDGTTVYTLVLDVTDTAISTPTEALRCSPKAIVAVAAPTMGSTVFHSDLVDALVARLPNGAVVPLLSGQVAALGDADATIDPYTQTHNVMMPGVRTANRVYTIDPGENKHVVWVYVLEEDPGDFTVKIVNGGTGGGDLIETDEAVMMKFKCDGSGDWALDEFAYLNL